MIHFSDIRSRVFSWADSARKTNKLLRPKLLGVTLLLSSLSPGASAADITLSWNANPAANVAGYMLYYGGASGYYTNSINTGTNRTVAVTGLTTNLTYYFVVTAFNTAGLESNFSTELAYTVITTQNSPPTLNPIPNLTINEDAGTQIVNLAGISDGSSNEIQTLTVTASSSNPNLTGTPTVSYTSPNSTGALNFTPVPNASGTATLTVSVNDGQAQSNLVTQSFTVTVLAINDPPTISSISNQTVLGAIPTPALPITVGDVETAAGSLTLSGSSANQSLVPNANIVFGGTGANRTVTVTPVIGQSGTATITVTVSDGTSTTSTSFVLTVIANSAPTISTIADQRINPGSSVGPLPFTISDAQTPAGNLTVQGSSSNPVLVPSANIVFGGTGGNRTVTVTPTSGQTGTATISLAVSDGQLSSSNRFVLTVANLNTAPTISSIAAQVTDEDTATGAIPFTIGDLESSSSSLVVSASASNPGLVPTGAMVLAGNNSNRTITITPAPDQSGTSTITLSVSDGALSASQSFLLIVNPVNDPPAISTIPDQTVPKNQNLSVLFTIGDIETPAANLTLTASSSNPAIATAQGMSFTGTGSDRTLKITPTRGRFGTSIIRVSVSDGITSTSTSFLLTVGSSALGATLPTGTILSAIPTSPGGLVITWQSQPGASYRVVFKNTLSDPAWIDLSNDISAVDVTTSWTDSTFSEASNRFYQILLLP